MNLWLVRGGIAAAVCVLVIGIFLVEESRIFFPCVEGIGFDGNYGPDAATAIANWSQQRTGNGALLRIKEDQPLQNFTVSSGPRKTGVRLAELYTLTDGNSYGELFADTSGNIYFRYTCK